MITCKEKPCQSLDSRRTGIDYSLYCDWHFALEPARQPYISLQVFQNPVTYCHIHPISHKYTVTILHVHAHFSNANSITYCDA